MLRTAVLGLLASLTHLQTLIALTHSTPMLYIVIHDEEVDHVVRAFVAPCASTRAVHANDDMGVVGFVEHGYDPWYSMLVGDHVQSLHFRLLVIHLASKSD